MCAAKVGQKRADDLGSVLTWAVGQGHTVAFVTFTARHHQGQALKAVLGGVGKAFTYVTQGRHWGRIKGDYGILGRARVLEITNGRNGWHPHFHVIFILEGQVDAAQGRKFSNELWTYWREGLKRQGMSAVRQVNGHDVGLDIKLSTQSGLVDALPEYLVKALTSEVTGAHNKEGRKKNSRTPFQLLEDIEKHGDADDLALWEEYEAATKGKQQIARCNSWKALERQLALVERTDEEIAAEDIGTEDELLLPPETWQAIKHCAELLLNAAEANGLSGARQWLRMRGLGWIEPDRAQDE